MPDYTSTSIFLWRDQEYIADPYPVYQQLRQLPQLPRTEDGIWLVSRYEDVQTLLRLQDFIRDGQYRFNLNAATPLRSIEEMRRHWLPFLDPPQHKVLKQFVHKTLYHCVTPEFIKRIGELSQDLLLTLQQKDQFDLIADYAYPLPVLMVSELLGLPAEHWPQLKKWSAVLARTLEPYPTTAMRDEFDQISEAFQVYLREVITTSTLIEKTVLGQYLLALQADSNLSQAELIYAAIFLFASGHETLSSLIGNGMLALIQHPEVAQALIANPAALSSAIEELLRYDSPVQILFQVAAKPVMLNGVSIQIRDQVALLLGAANRDETVFSQANHIIIDRTPNRHLAFGAGSHKCIGAKLARCVAKIAFTDLLGLLPLRCVHDITCRKKTVVLRGLRSLSCQR